MTSYSVYCHTFPDGKKYFGITSQDPEKRWNHGNGYKDQKVFTAISQYGWENIKHEVIATGLSQEEAEALEMDLIRDYETIRNGWNVATGGHVHKSYLCKDLLQMYETLKKWVKRYPSINVYLKSMGADIPHESEFVKNHVQVSTLFNEIYERCPKPVNLHDPFDCSRLRLTLLVELERIMKGGDNTACQ